LGKNLIAMKVISILFSFIFQGLCYSQGVSYSYDSNGRIIGYNSNCTSVKFFYDSDGNRVATSFSSIQVNPQVLHNNCFAGTSGVINLQPTQSYLYSWSNGLNSTSISNLAAGIYTVTITDVSNSNSCIKYFNVLQPDSFVLSVLTSSSSCYNYANGSAQIDTNSIDIGQYHFNWSNGIQGIQATNLPAGNYTVTATNNVTGCSQVFPFAISHPSSTVSSININNASCYGAADGFAAINVISNSNNYSFHWPNGNLTNNAANLSAGVYHVSVTNNQSGCSEDVPVIINQPNLLNTFVSTVEPNCIGSSSGSITVGSSGGTIPYQYSINGSPFQTAPNFSSLIGGTYQIVTRDAHYCLDTLTNINLPDITAQNGLPVNQASQTMVSPYPQSNEWYQMGNPILVSNSNSFQCQDGATYYVIGQDANGCTATSALATCWTTNINEVHTGYNFKVYPSPNNGGFFVQFSGDIGTFYTLEVLTPESRIVERKTGILETTSAIIPMNLKKVSTGNYFVRLSILSTEEVRQIEIVKH
jgi:hypothetical protein